MRKGSEDPSLAWGAGTLNHRWPLRLPPVFVDAAHLGSVGRNITAATTLGMAQHDEEAASQSRRDFLELGGGEAGPATRPPGRAPGRRAPPPRTARALPGLARRAPCAKEPLFTASARRKGAQEAAFPILVRLRRTGRP